MRIQQKEEAEASTKQAEATTGAGREALVQSGHSAEQPRMREGRAGTRSLLSRELLENESHSMCPAPYCPVHLGDEVLSALRQ